MVACNICYIACSSYYGFCSRLVSLLGDLVKWFGSVFYPAEWKEHSSIVPCKLSWYHFYWALWTIPNPSSDS